MLQKVLNLCPLQSLLQRTDTLQSDLEGVLEASKDLISHLEPSAASLVQSESRLLSRGVLQLSQTLTEKLGQQQVQLHEWICVFVGFCKTELDFCPLCLTEVH